MSQSGFSEMRGRRTLKVPSRSRGSKISRTSGRDTKEGTDHYRRKRDKGCPNKIKQDFYRRRNGEKSKNTKVR